MTRNLAMLLGIFLAACTTPTVDELTKLEVRVLRAPASAVRVRVVSGGATREADLADRAATVRFADLPPAGSLPRATALGADGSELETIDAGATANDGHLVVTFDFRPCEADDRFGKDCFSGLGLCQVAGTFRCADDHRAVACSAIALPPGVEICNGYDDDCDGDTDEPADLAPPPCELAEGVCAGGKRTCAGAAGWSECDYGPDFEAHETRCDGRDNDCDGKADPMVGRDASACGGCNAPCAGDATCVAGRCFDAPAVVGASVHDGEWGVARDAAITLTFSRAMEASSVASALSLGAAFSTSWNAAATELTVRPTAPLAVSTRFVLSLATTAKDTRGKALADPFRAEFATAPTPGLFVYGGSIDDPPYSDRSSWMLALVPGAPPRWYRLADGTGAPSQRTGALLVDDPARRRVLLVGGTPTFAAPVSEVWAFDPTGWTKLVADVPGTGFSSPMGGVDAATDSLVVYGGTRGGGCLKSAVKMGLSAPAGFSPLAVSGAIDGFEEPMSVWVPGTRTLWITQGYGERNAAGCWTPPTNAPLQNPKTYTLTLGEGGFTAAQVPFDHPIPRALGAAAWDGAQLVTYGGDGSSHADEAWSLDGAGWHLLAQNGTGPGAMRAGSMVFDPVARRFVVFGGDSPNTADARNSVFSFTVSGRSGTWTALAPVGVAPSPRTSFAYAAVADAGPLVVAK